MGRKIATLLLILLLLSVAPFFPIHVSVAPEQSPRIRWSGENIALESVSWRPDNSYGLLVSQDGKVLKYDGYNFEVLNDSLGFTPYDVAWKPDNSYAVIVGSQGHIVLYDGISFSSFSAPNTNNLNKVSWKSDGAYALLAGNGGTLLRFDGISTVSIESHTTNNLQSIGWNPTGSKALITGESGTILEYSHVDGKVYWFGENTQLQDIDWNPADTLGLVIGYEGICLGYDGFTFQVLNDSLGFNAFAVDWKPDGSQATIIGSGGHITKYYEGVFTSVSSPTTNDLRAVSWRSDGSYALVAGASGTLLVFNGLTVGVIQSKSNCNFYGIGWDSGSQKALVVGDSGGALLFDATKPPGQQVYWLGQNINLVNIAWKPDNSYGLIVGYEGIVLKYDGARFTRLIVGLSSILNDVVWKPDGSYAVLVGNEGIAVKYDGVLFSSLSTGTTNDLIKAAWRPDGSIALVVGNGGTILKYDGTSFVPVMSTAVSFIDNLKSVSWALDSTYAIILGESGIALRYNPSENKVYWLGKNLALDMVAWKPDGSHCLIVGAGGIVMKYDGNYFEPLVTGLATQLYDVQWNNAGTEALIVGSEGIAVLYNGASFISLTPATTNNLYKIGWSPDDSYALIVGAQGLALRYHGGIFDTLSSGTSVDLNGISWNTTHALVVGNSGTVLSWDGTDFQPLDSGITLKLWDVDWRPDQSYALIVSQSGNLLKFDGTSFTQLSTGDSRDFYGNTRCSLRWNPNGAYVLITGYYSQSPYYRLWRYNETTTIRYELRNLAWGVDWHPLHAYALVVGSYGEVIKYDGSSLSYLSASAYRTLWDAEWKPDNSYALIVSEYGELLKFNGSFFTFISTGDSSDFYYGYPCRLSWKPDGSYVLITGRRGSSPYYCLWKYDETSFEEITLRSYPCSVDWRQDGEYALIVGYAGQVVRYDGVSLLYHSASTSYNLWDVDWKPDGSYALIISQYGEVLKFFSVLFTHHTTGDSSDFYYNERCSVDWHPFGTYALITGRRGASPYYCLWRYDGATFTRFPLRNRAWDVEWRQDGVYSLMVGDRGQVVRYDGVSLLYHSASTSYNLWDVDWKPDGSYALIISQYGEVLKFNGWMVTYDVTGDSSDFYYNERCSVDWHDSGIWCVITGRRGSSPYYCLWRYDGATFVRVTLSTMARDVAFQPGGDYCIAVGDSGHAWTYDSINLLPLATGVTADLFGVSWKPDGTYALIVGKTGTILKYDGLFFTPLDSGTSQDLKAVAWSRDGSYALIAGVSGTVLRYNGTHFTQLDSGVTQELVSIDFGTTTALIAGRTGCLLKYDGGFASVPLNTTANLQAVAWAPTGNYAIVTALEGRMWKVYFGPPEAPLGVAVAADPSILHSSDISKITVDVSNGSTPISGATVQLRSNLEGTFSPVIDLGNGTYIANYTAPFVYRMTTDRIIATASKTGFTPGLGYIDVSVKPIEDLFVSEVELIQVTENPKALIGGKKTVFCAHIESSFGARIWTELEVEYNFLSSSYVETGPSGNGVPIDPGSNRIYIPGGPALPATSVPWISGSQPPWFNWSTIGIDSTIRVTVDPFDKIGEGNEINNVMEVQMKIVESKDLRILCVPVYFPDIQQLPLNPQLNDEMDFVLATYPVAEDRFFWAQSQPFPWPGVPPVPLNPNNQAQQAEFLEWLYWRVAVPISIMAVMLGYDRAVIVIHDMGQNWGGIAIGMLRFPENRVPVLITEGAREGAVAHEIGHTYYLWHPHDIGPTVYDAKRFWVLERDYEDVVSTFMSYLPPPLWIDPGRYDSDPKEWVQLNPFVGTWRWNLFEQLKVGIDPEIVIVQGEVHNNGTINADQPWFFLQEGIPDLLSQTSGNYSIYLLDNSSQALDYFGFNVSFSYFLDLNGTLTSIETECVPFVFKVPFLSGTRTIEIRNMTGHTLVSRLVSPNKPSVNVTFPNGGETLTSGANYTITWESFDLDGDQLYFSITYSTDAGQSWLPIATGLNQTSCVWNTSYLEPGTKYHIKVIASDGVNTCEDLSDDTFTVSTGTHDLALLGIECSKTTVGTGYDLQINVTISNMGDFTEVFNVNINANTTAVSTLTNITLPSGNSTTLTFTWNTTGFAKGNYTISANATIVSGETDTADNSYIDGTVRVNMVGDVAPEYGIVDIVDIVYVAIHFGAEKGQPEYEPNADINGDGIIDIVDIVIVAIHFGETDP